MLLIILIFHAKTIEKADLKEILWKKPFQG